MRGVSHAAPLPSLPFDAWQETYATLHRWTQVVGKVRLALAPHVNHWWQVPLYVTARGLTTSPMPYGTRTIQIDFDFVDHRLRLLTDDPDEVALPLEPRSVADFYRAFTEALQSLGLDVPIWAVPVEIEEAVPFEQDTTHAAYDADYARRFWEVLLFADRVLQQFRGRFTGKVSPVHFFWGSFDLAVTRFSGREAPPHPGGVPGLADWVTREAYSHEVSSAGFWPGGPGLPEPVFYSYAYPEPSGFREASNLPEAAYYFEKMSEYVLPYEAVRTAADPAGLLLQFLQSTYEAAADAADWDREMLER